MMDHTSNFGEAVITSESVSAVADQIWAKATELRDDDWLVFTAKYEESGTQLDVVEPAEDQITSLEEGYAVLRPIPYKIEKIHDGNYQASFREANIAIGGVDEQDAYQSLVAEILDTFDTLTDEPLLVPDLILQLQVLRTYIAKA